MCGGDSEKPSCDTLVASCSAKDPPCPPPDKWLADALSVMCPKDKKFLDDLRATGVDITAYDRIYYEDPIYDGKKWTTTTFEAGGSNGGGKIDILTKGESKNSVAETIFHEGTHQSQPSSMSWSEKEYDAYTKTEQWAIDHGLPPTRSGFRTTDADGNPIPDTAAIKKKVDKDYPITKEEVTAPAPPPPASPAAPPPPPPVTKSYTVVGKDAAGNTVLENDADSSDQITRPPKKGDTFAGGQKTEPPGGRKALLCQLKCS